MPTNKLEKKKKKKGFSAGYVGSFYRKLADNVDNFIGSDFYSQLTSNIPNDNVRKYILATSDFAKSIQNHYVTKERINDASFRQKLDPISKNILKRLNPLELVFEDVSTFHAENPIVGSLLREIDLKKTKQIVILSNHYQVSQGKNLRYKKDSTSYAT